MEKSIIDLQKGIKVREIIYEAVEMMNKDKLKAAGILIEAALELLSD